MKTLLPLDSTLYLKRLVRALNAEAMTGNGFYAHFPHVTRRCNLARLKGGILQVRILADGGYWESVYGEISFSPANGGSITASRHA